MKASILRPGDQVRIGSRTMVFQRREKRHCQPALNIFLCADYQGLYGPNDKGTVTMNDRYFSRNCVAT